jgi:hypothetical protein
MSKQRGVYLYTNILLPLFILNSVLVNIFHQRNKFFGPDNIFIRPKYDSMYELTFSEPGLFKKVGYEVGEGKNIGVMTGQIADVFLYDRYFLNHVYYFESWYQGMRLNQDVHLDKLFFVSSTLKPGKSDRYLGVLDNLKNDKLYVRDMHGGSYRSLKR